MIATAPWKQVNKNFVVVPKNKLIEGSFYGLSSLPIYRLLSFMQIVVDARKCFTFIILLFQKKIAFSST